MYGLLTVRDVKMAGNWPISFYACLWAETESRSINTKMTYYMEKKEQSFLVSGHSANPERVRKRHLGRSRSHSQDLVYLARSRCQPFNKKILLQRKG